jgi:hypothetical protein
MYVCTQTHTHTHTHTHTYTHHIGDSPPYYDPTFQTTAQMNAEREAIEVKRVSEMERWPAENVAVYTHTHTDTHTHTHTHIQARQ